jgi:putative ABC transport system permease protein
MNQLWQDLRYGARMLLKKPGFTFVAVITLALGIGANTAVFSVVHAVLLKPLPYKDAERIVVANVSPPDFRDVKEWAQSFDQMATWASNLYNVTTNGETTQVRGAIVSPEFLPMLGQPALGRFWRPEEDMENLAVISHDYWQSGFGGVADIIGKTIKLYGKPHTIVGVTPPEFQYPSREFKLWNTMGAAMAEAKGQMENRQFRIFRAVARLKPGVSAVASVEPMLEPSNFRTMEQLVSESVAQPRFNTTLLAAFAALALALAAIGIYGVIAYSVTQRTHEIGVRLALGARKGDVIRLVLKQGMTPAFVGAAIGLAGAWAMTRLLSGLLFEVSATDPATFAAVTMLLMAIALLACWIPARRAAKVDPMIALRYE